MTDGRLAEKTSRKGVFLCASEGPKMRKAGRRGVCRFVEREASRRWRSESREGSGGPIRSAGPREPVGPVPRREGLPGVDRGGIGPGRSPAGGASRAQEKTSRRPSLPHVDTFYRTLADSAARRPGRKCTHAATGPIRPMGPIGPIRRIGRIGPIGRASPCRRGVGAVRRPRKSPEDRQSDLENDDKRGSLGRVERFYAGNPGVYP